MAFLVPPSFAYAAVQRGIWRAGGVAVPLAISHPPAELEYVIRDSGARDRRRRPGLRGRAGAGRRRASARDLVTTDRGRCAAAPAAALPHLGVDAPGDDHLHQRHDRPAQGRR